MRILLTIMGIMVLTGVAFAGTDPVNDGTVADLVPCDLTSVCLDWDFSVGNHGFTAAPCAAGSLPVWAYGNETTIPGSPGNVWGTVLNANYLNNAGDALSSPLFQVTPDCFLMEINHYVHIESNWDGGNVEVNGIIIPPMTGYPGTCNSYPLCVANEPAFTGFGSQGASEIWVARCFDLSQFIGQTIHVDFVFGSDGTVTYPGWYLAYVKVGTDSPLAVDSSTWGAIKDQFK